MTGRAGLSALLEELRQLDGRTLEMTLAALSGAERAQVLALLEDGSAATLSFEALAAISPWLMKKVDAARIAVRTKGPAGGMTNAAREALLKAFADLGSGDGSDAEIKGARRPWRLGQVLKLGKRAKAA